MTKFYYLMIILNLGVACFGGVFSVMGLVWAAVWSALLWRSL